MAQEQSALRHVSGDEIVRDFEAAIHEFRIQTFRTFALNLTIDLKPGTAPTTTDNGECVIHYRWIISFFQDGRGAIKVRLDAREEGKVQVLFNSQWQSPDTWLETFLPRVDRSFENDLDFRLFCRTVQHRWWLANRRNFRLFDLPPEIRLIIYQMVTRQGKWTRQPSGQLEEVGFDDSVYEGLLLANKRLHNEVAPVLAYKKRRDLY